MMTKIDTKDWIEAVREAEAVENGAESYYAGDETASSGRHWTVYNAGRAEYPYAELEENFFQWCLNNLPEDSEAFKVWQSSSEVCADDYHAIGKWAMDMLSDWNKKTDEDWQVYDVLYDIAQKWARMEEF